MSRHGLTDRTPREMRQIKQKQKVIKEKANDTSTSTSTMMGRRCTRNTIVIIVFVSIIIGFTLSNIYHSVKITTTTVTMMMTTMIDAPTTIITVVDSSSSLYNSSNETLTTTTSSNINNGPNSNSSINSKVVLPEWIIDYLTLSLIHI